MKTAEEILDKWLHNYPWQHWSKKNAIKAMDEYAAQFMNTTKCYNCEGTGKACNVTCPICNGAGKYILLPIITNTAT